MVQKVVEIVGISEKGFSEAAQDAITVCARTVRGIQWARVTEMECKVEGERIVEYRSLMRIYFDVES
ncbi:MAG: dodecin family protein [Methanomassiliicoccus sp.]|nr:dodecin family protein [Methanomassiliicoccus sp.]